MLLLRFRLWLAYKLGLMDKRRERDYLRLRRALWLNRAYKRLIRRAKWDRWFTAMDRVQKIRAIRRKRGER